MDKDGCFGTIQIGGKMVLDSDCNLKVAQLQAKGASHFKGDVVIDGQLTVGKTAATAAAAELFDAKTAYFAALEKTYRSQPSVSWTTFAADQATHKGKVVLLTQADFANGTLRVQQPCLLQLTQTIQFNPNRPLTWLDGGAAVTTDFAEAAAIDPARTLDWMPDETNGTNNAQYFEPEVLFAYGLGFFAAIAIECEDVIVNLNGYTLQQHPEHALQQRFFACIELADQPFMPLQGPSNFGAVLRAAKNCLIKNGKIGLSSHHGIHGNDCDEIMIDGVEFSDFEVAAVALNGCNGGYARNVTVVRNRRDIPVIGSYSAARFIKSFVKAVQDRALSNGTLDAAYDALKVDMDATFNAIVFGSGAVPAVFENASGIIDGPFYGMLFNVKGVAVNGFLETRNTPKATETTDLHFKNCSINGLHGAIREVIALTHPDGGVQVDTAGAVLKFFDDAATVVGGNKYYYSAAASLPAVQIELAKVKHTLTEGAQSTSFLGTLKIHRGVQLWKDNPTWYFLRTDNQMKLYDNTDSAVLISGNPVVYFIVGNGDSMHHVIKGGMGLRVDGVSGMTFDNCVVSDVYNQSERGTEFAGKYISSHSAQGQLVGYQGGQTYGIVLSAVNDVSSSKLNISGIRSKESQARALAVQNESQHCCFLDTTISNVKADAGYSGSESRLPNPECLAVGVSVKRHCQNVEFCRTQITDTFSNYPWSETPYEILSAGVKMS